MTMFDLNALEVFEEDLQRVIERSEACKAAVRETIERSSEMLDKCRALNRGKGDGPDCPASGAVRS